VSRRPSSWPHTPSSSSCGKVHFPPSLARACPTIGRSRDSISISNMTFHYSNLSTTKVRSTASMPKFVLPFPFLSHVIGWLTMLNVVSNSSPLFDDSALPPDPREPARTSSEIAREGTERQECRRRRTLTTRDDAYYGWGRLSRCAENGGWEEAIRRVRPSPPPDDDDDGGRHGHVDVRAGIGFLRRRILRRRLRRRDARRDEDELSMRPLLPSPHITPPAAARPLRARRPPRPRRRKHGFAPSGSGTLCGTLSGRSIVN
jgi:hypothetical protein